MSSKFHVWVEDGSDVMSESDFLSSTERVSGFQPNTLAKSSTVNAAVRQSNLVVCALMDAIVSASDNVDLRSSVTDVMNVIKAHLMIDGNIINSGLGSILKDSSNSIGPVKSFLYGHGLYSNKDYCSVFGKWNNHSTASLLEVGVGTSNSDRKTAFRVSQTGSVESTNKMNSENSVLTVKNSVIEITINGSMFDRDIAEGSSMEDIVYDFGAITNALIGINTDVGRVYDVKLNTNSYGSYFGKLIIGEDSVTGDKLKYEFHVERCNTLPTHNLCKKVIFVFDGDTEEEEEGTFYYSSTEDYRTLDEDDYYTSTAVIYQGLLYDSAVITNYYRVNKVWNY